MTTFFNEQPYFDDFDENKNYMRVLFKPGYAVQSRELTQLQTILSNQIEKFGNHIFKNGSPITGGKISLDSKANYVVLEKQYGGVDITPENFLDKEVEIYDNATKTVRAKVIAVDTNNSTGLPILVLYYLSGDKFVESDTIKINGQSIFAQLRSTNAVGRSYVASIQEGVYYFKGSFVKVVPQFLVLETIYVSGYDSTSVVNNPSYKVGIEFDDNIVTSETDISLLDPAQGAFNYQAPGADRFQVDVRLSKRLISSSDLSNFFEIVRVVNGEKTKEVQYPIYSEIEKTLARRTFDESGNYTVDPFSLTLEEGTLSGSFDVVLDPGKAYVQGFEFETTAPTRISVSRARSTEDVSEDLISTNFSSYLVLNNVTGVLNIEEYPQLDIHCVDRANVNTATATAYNSSKIGTIRVSNMDYNDATTSTLGNTHSFTVNVFESNTAPITGTLLGNTTSFHTTTRIVLPAGFSSTLTANAYANAYFRITDGAGLGIAPLLILSSNSTTINIESGLTFTPNANTFSIETDIKIARSLVRNVSSSIVFSGDIDSDSKENELTFINEPLLNQYFFTLPYDSVQDSTIDNLDFFVKKVYNPAPSATVGSTVGKITINTEGDDSFAFSNGGTLSDTTILDNIICFVKSTSVGNTTSGIYPGRPLSLANNYFAVTSPDDTTVDIELNTNNIDATFIVTTKINNGETSAKNLRKKELLPKNSYVHTKVAYELDPVTGLDSANTATMLPVSGVGYVFVDSSYLDSDNDIASTFFNDPQILKDLRTPGKPVSLQIPDVYRIVRITDSQNTQINVENSMLTSDAYDVTNRYDFNNGKKITHYDHATIKLKRGATPPSGTVYVQYEYFKHFSPSGDTEGLFTVDSYLQTGSNFTYDKIPKTFDKDGNLIDSRSVLDFRPTREIASNNFFGSLNVDPNREAVLNYSYYTSRIDQIVVKPSKEFFVITGNPGITPVPNPVETGDMLIYSLFIPAYTASVKDVKIKFFDNRRYTMKDVGDIQERIKNLEYYVSLDSLEKETASLKVLDANGLERSKYGFFVDNFTTILNQATNTDLRGQDYNRNLVEESELRPASLKKNVRMIIGGLTGSNYRLKDSAFNGVITCNYTEENLNGSSKLQPFATKTQPVAGALFAKFNGRGRLYPDTDLKTDISYLPSVNINPVNGLDEALKFIDNSLDFISSTVLKPWEFDVNNPLARIPDRPPVSTTNVTTSTWQGVNSSGQRGTFRQTSTRNREFLSAGTNLSQNGIVVNDPSKQEIDIISDIAISPWIKPSRVVFSFEGLRPNTNFYHFFDGQDINKNVIAPNKYLLESPDEFVLTSNLSFKVGDSVIVANTVAEITNAKNAMVSSQIYDDWAFLWKVSFVDDVNKSIHLVNDFSSVGNPESLNYLPNTDMFISSIPIAGVSETYKISEVLEHKSGISRQNNTSSSQIKLAADAPNVNIAGSKINLIHNFKVLPDNNSNYSVSTKQYTIINYDTDTKIATLDSTIDQSFRPSNSNETQYITYSIGNNRSNKSGVVSGMFWLDSARFRVGQRTFRVTESFNNSYDADAISFADAQHLSNALQEVKKQKLVFSTYNIGVAPQTQALTSDYVLKDVTNVTTNFVPFPPVDPLAQTFFVDDKIYPDGVFLSSVELFFKDKDSGNIPVSVEIRPTVNGTPHASYWYPESFVSKQPEEINTSDSPSFNDATTITTFDFKTPVYLKPGFYALVVKADTPEYTLWVAEKGSTTTDGQVIGAQPYMGTLYKSQNSMEYLPIINEDMMFNINRCKFATGSTSTVYFGNDVTLRVLGGSNAPSSSITEPVDAFRFNQNVIIPNEAKTVVNYSFVSTPYGGTRDVVYRNFSPFVKYFCGEDSSYPIGERRKQLGNFNDFVVRAQLTTTDDKISPVLALTGCSLDYFQNFINNAEIQYNDEKKDLVIVSSGQGYSNSNTLTISSNTGSLFAATLIVSNTGNGNVVSVNVTSNGSGYVDDFSLVYAKTPTITSNATIAVTTEFSAAGGPCTSRYITKKVTLADGFDAGDLKVLLDANLPEGSDIHVYYKVLSADDNTPFEERPYGKMVLATEPPAPAPNRFDFVELEYRPTLVGGFINYLGNNGSTYDTFREFSIKITMTSSDPSVIPRIKNLRVIAMPEE